MYPSEGLQTALNKMREMSVESNSIYHQFVPLVTSSTSIGEFGQPILDSQNLNVMNDFISLLKKIVMTAVETKTFNNPLAQLEGDKMPLGQFIEDVYVQPQSGRAFNPNDFAGILQKYEAKIATQYLSVNSDVQFPVSITKEKIRNAFTSWNNLENFISGIVNSLFNGAYILRYNQTKGLPLAAYTAGAIQTEKVDAVVDETTGKALLKKMRADYNKMQIPSTQYNAWNKVKGGDLALKTWSNPDDIIVMISADVEANVSVDVLAAAFNMDKADFLGRVIVVDSFDQYNEDGTVAVDGSDIQAMIADRSWFKIKTQDFAMDEWYNANNRCWTYYLNDVRMVNYSLFANAKIYTSGDAPTPTPSVDSLSFNSGAINIFQGGSEVLSIVTTPEDALVTISLDVEGLEGATGVTATYEGDKRVVIDVAADATANGQFVVTATCAENPELSATCTVTVAEAPIHAESIALDNASVTIVKGNDATITIIPTPENAQIGVYGDLTPASEYITLTPNYTGTPTLFNVAVGADAEAGEYSLVITDSNSEQSATATITVTNE